MKKIGVQCNTYKAQQYLMPYVISLFNQNFVNAYNLNEVLWEHPPSLIILNNITTITPAIHLQIKKHHTPIFLINSDDQTVEHVCAKFNTSNANFNHKGELINIKKRLELIKIIHNIEHDILNLRTDKFSCGIHRPKYYVGDSIGY